MIIDCDVSISDPNSPPNRYSQAKVGIGFDKKDHRYYLVIVRNKQKDRFRLTASNVVIRGDTFVITNPKKLIMLKNVDFSIFAMFKRLARKILVNHQPLPAVPSVETILQSKMMPRSALINIVNQIKKLDNPILSNVKIESITTLRWQQIDKLWSLKNLSELTITGCKLNKIPFVLNQLKQLAHLNMSDNQIEEIPMWFTQEMHRLKTINLSHNLIRIIPYEIIRLEKCIVLYFNHNRIEHFPLSLLYHFFRNPSQYSKIDFSHNSMRAFPFYASSSLPREFDYEFHGIFKIDPNPWRKHEDYSLPKIPSERYPFEADTLYGKCLEIAINNFKLREKLFDYRQTPKQIYDHLQRVLFICHKCRKLKLRIRYETGSFYRGLNMFGFNMFGFNVLYHSVPRYLIYCSDC